MSVHPFVAFPSSSSVNFLHTLTLSPTHQKRPTFDHWRIGRILSSFLFSVLYLVSVSHLPFVLLRVGRTYVSTHASFSIHVYPYNTTSLSHCPSLYSHFDYSSLSPSSTNTIPLSLFLAGDDSLYHFCLLSAFLFANLYDVVVRVSRFVVPWFSS